MVANQILDAKSLQADLYWTRMDSKVKRRSDLKRRSLYFVVLYRWTASALSYAVLFVLGLFTAGWLWPKSLRKRVLTVGLSGMQEKKEKKKDIASRKGQDY